MSTESHHINAPLSLVTGGGGFLGQYIVEQLLARGERVRSLSRGRYPALDELGVEQTQGDITDADVVAAACEGCGTVYHVAAKAGVWGKHSDFRAINVDGTRHVIDACLKHGVPKLVFTSSPSVVWQPGDLEGVDEFAPYPERFNCAYPETKAESERLVLDANGRDGLLTVALRPHLIFGPRDNHLIPRVIERARSGQLRRVGDGTNLVDIVYVENAAEAHLLAADRLTPGSPVAGQAYFISQGEPVNLWEWINQLLEAVGVAPVRRSISYGAARAVGAILEVLYTLVGATSEPKMTRFVAHQLAKSHYFSIDKARADLDYEPRVSTEEGLRRTVESFRNRD